MHDVVYDHISKRIMGGNQDNGTCEQTSIGGTIWSAVLGGDGGDVAADDLTSATQSTRYGSYQYLDGFFRRLMNSSGVATSWTFPARTVIGGSNFQGQFVTPIELNRVDPRRILFAGSNDLYESLDRGDTITGLDFNHHVTAAVYGGRWASGTDNVDVIWAISGQYVYERTSGSGAPVQTSSSPGTVYLYDIAVDPNDWWKAYVVNSAGQVFSTSDAGATWTNITGNLANGTTDVRTIVFIAGNPNAIVVGGLNGTFRMATNNPGVWNQLGTGLSNAIVHDLDFDPLDDTLVASTLGRGAWKLSGVAVSGTLPSLSINDVSVTEGNAGVNWATFTVSLSAPVGYTVGVNYATANGTATGQSATFSAASSVSVQGANTYPYPSTITVSGITDPIRKVTVNLNQFYHTYSDDVDVLLVGPGGQTVVLLSDAGVGTLSQFLDFTFDDGAAGPLPQWSALMSGTYRPTDYEVGQDFFGSPAPGAPYGYALSVFNGTAANGTWSLYVVDDYSSADDGAFYGGWSLTFSSGDYSPTSGPLSFNPGTTSKSVSVPVFPDTTPEANETFSVNLSTPSNATIGDFQGVATIVNDDSVAAPANVVSTATTTTNVNVTWTAAPGATSYAVYRRSGGGTYSLVGSPSASPFNDSTASANTAYLYKVRGVAGGVESADSNFDLATTVIFTDPVLSTGGNLKVAHFTELLTAVNAVRTLAGYAAVAFTAPAPSVGTNILGAHIIDLRNGLNPARSALGLAAPSYTDPTITVGSTGIKPPHITEVRSGVQ